MRFRCVRLRVPPCLCLAHIFGCHQGVATDDMQWHPVSGILSVPNHLPATRAVAITVAQWHLSVAPHLQRLNKRTAPHITSYVHQTVPINSSTKPAQGTK